MNILIYGAGAVGGYVGGKLALAGQRVTLIARPGTAAAIQVNGLQLSEGGETRRAPVRAVESLVEAVDGPAYDLIVLGMKGYDLAGAVDQLAAVYPEPAQVMSTQNGIGLEEMIAARFGPARTLAGSVTIPISRGAPNHLMVERAGRGLGVAPVMPGRPVAEWVTLFREAGINAGARDDYRAMKWSKAFLNIMGNATSAILNRPPAELYRLRSIFDLEMHMLRETLAVMGRMGIKVINLPGATARPLARSLAYAPEFLRRLVFTQVIVHGRGDKMPSFHIDLSSGKGQSEVAFHNGAIAAAGRQAYVPAPVNAALYDTLQQLCQDRSRRAWFDGRPDRLLAVVREYEKGEVTI
jgi:2-dehydropantoate 2-reductase